MESRPHRGSLTGVRGWLRRIGRRAGHPAPLALSRYLDGELTARDRRAVEAHVRECGGCRRLLRSLSRTVRVLGSLGAGAPAGQSEAIIAALSAEARPQRRQFRWRPVLRYCLGRAQLRFTVPIALLVGAVLSLVNQGGMLLAGELDPAMCAICALNFVLPFIAMNVVLVGAARAAWRRR
jgi:anti-sigma factor RsiW